MDNDSKNPAAVVLGSKGGRARASRLPPSRRSEIAKDASAARWRHHRKVLSATHAGTMTVGDAEIDCAVLELQPGEERPRRVVSERAFMRALGRSQAGGQTYQRRDADGGEGGGDQLPIYLALRGLKPFIPYDFSVATIPYRYNGTIAHGIEATAMPRVCEIWLAARQAGALRPSQLPTAAKAEVLIRGFATVGIIALVDEATGYQHDRARAALAEILEQYIAKELARWAKVFSDDYYRHLFRLKGLDYNAFSTLRPPMIGKLTASIVYDRLAPGILAELRAKNPRGSGGSRKAKHHQWLTQDVGSQKLREHLAVVDALMKISSTYEQFISSLDRVAPRYGHSLMLPFDNIDSGPIRTA